MQKIQIVIICQCDPAASIRDYDPDDICIDNTLEACICDAQFLLRPLALGFPFHHIEREGNIQPYLLKQALFLPHCEEINIGCIKVQKPYDLPILSDGHRGCRMIAISGGGFMPVCHTWVILDIITGLDETRSRRKTDQPILERSHVQIDILKRQPVLSLAGLCHRTQLACSRIIETYPCQTELPKLHSDATDTFEKLLLILDSYNDLIHLTQRGIQPTKVDVLNLRAVDPLCIEIDQW